MSLSSLLLQTLEGRDSLLHLPSPEKAAWHRVNPPNAALSWALRAPKSSPLSAFFILTYLHLFYCAKSIIQTGRCSGHFEDIHLPTVSLTLPSSCSHDLYLPLPAFSNVATKTLCTQKDQPSFLHNYPADRLNQGCCVNLAGFAKSCTGHLFPARLCCLCVCELAKGK